MNISVVIPAYNESENIAPTVEELFLALGRIHSIGKVQIIVVDDHSSDDMCGAVSRLGDPCVLCIRLSRRSGSHTALRAGIAEAAGDAVLCISADGQDDPSCVGAMLEKWQGGAQVVWGLRKDRRGERWVQKTPARVFYQCLTRLTDAGDASVDISRASFYLIDRTVADAVRSCRERNTSLFGLIVWLGFNQNFVEYERRARRYGKSKWNFSGLLNLAKDWLIAFARPPLTVAIAAGTGIAAAGLAALILLTSLALGGGCVKGWGVLMAVVLCLGGAQIILLGIIGEYVWRALDEARARPLYFIEKRTDTGSASPSR